MRQYTHLLESGQDDLKIYEITDKIILNQTKQFGEQSSFDFCCVDDRRRPDEEKGLTYYGYC